MVSQTYVDGDWIEGNVPLIGADSHAIWLGSITFDGARAFEGVTPDLDRHCDRLINSTKVMNMEPMLSAGEIEELALDGVKRFAPESALYIRPMFWADAALDVLVPDPESTRFALTIFEAAMPTGAGFSCCLSTYRRPGPETAPTDAKASCHYPNSSRALIEARNRGFQNPVMRDGLGHVAEFATSNIWIVKDGVAITPEVTVTAVCPPAPFENCSTSIDIQIDIITNTIKVGTKSYMIDTCQFYNMINMINYMRYISKILVGLVIFFYITLS